MKSNTSKWIFGLLILISFQNCDYKTETRATKSTTYKLTDSSRAKLEDALASIIKSNTSPDDTTIVGRFVSQQEFNDDQYSITVDTGDTTLTLIELYPLEESSISRLKKEGDNITLSYNASNRTVKFIAATFEPLK